LSATLLLPLYTGVSPEAWQVLLRFHDLLSTP
jgi:hypothetical protein